MMLELERNCLQSQSFWTSTNRIPVPWPILSPTKGELLPAGNLRSDSDSKSKILRKRIQARRLYCRRPPSSTLTVATPQSVGRVSSPQSCTKTYRQVDGGAGGSVFLRECRM